VDGCLTVDSVVCPVCLVFLAYSYLFRQLPAIFLMEVAIAALFLNQFCSIKIPTILQKGIIWAPKASCRNSSSIRHRWLDYYYVHHQQCAVLLSIVFIGTPLLLCGPGCPPAIGTAISWLV